MAARDALTAVGAELRRLGVKSAFGTAGTFQSLVLGDDGRTCVGVRAADGTEWAGDLVVLAMGAWTPVMMDLEGQCVSKVSPAALASLSLTEQGWQFGHIQLTPQETETLRDMPSMYNSELVSMDPSVTR